MAYVPEASTWTTGVYQLEVSDPVQGGPGGIDNQQATDLGNRTKWLKDKLAAVVVTPVWTEVVMTTTGTWTCPAGVTQILVLDAVAGGGGGGGIISPGSTRGGGGGEGARVSNILLTVVPNTVYTITIGAGGAGGANHTSGYDPAALGADGADTSFGALLVLGAGQGAGDAGGSTTEPGGAGGTVTVNGITYTGGHGESFLLGGGGYQNGGGVSGGYFIDTDSVVTATNGGGGFGGAATYDDGDGGDGAAGYLRFAYLTNTVTGNT